MGSLVLAPNQIKWRLTPSVKLDNPFNLLPLLPLLRPTTSSKTHFFYRPSMSRNHAERGLPPDAGAVITSRLIDSFVKMLPSQQEKRGDKKLETTREIAQEFGDVISQTDHQIIEERITFAREMKVGLDEKSGLSKFLHAQEYRRAARDAYRYAKRVSDRGRDDAYFSQPYGTSSAPANDNFSRIIRVARSLYRCHLSCKDAFPSQNLKEQWIAAVWREAYERTGGFPGSPPLTDEFVVSSITLLTDMKKEIMHHVASFYQFDSSRAPSSISRNARYAQALLTNMTFIYSDPNVGGTPHHPYRHPIIQKAINMMWFQSKDGDGIVFHEYFTTIPIEAIALALTVIECCITEWTDGTHKISAWNEGRYEVTYRSHVKSLTDLRDLNRPQGGELLAQIQHDLLRDARVHAGAPFDPVTGSGRLQPGALHAALHENGPIPTFTFTES